VWGRYGQARAALEQAVREARAAGDAYLAALARTFIAWSIYLQGDPASARPVFEQAREGFQSVGDRQGIANLTIAIGLCALGCGDHQEARSLVREGLQLARGIDFRWGELFGLDAASLLAARTRNWEAAATLLGATQLLRESSPAPPIGVRESAIAAVKGALDPDSLAALWDKARVMPLDEAIAYALQHLRGPDR
jgi:tetratricopeptide (TPR) repeat protein